MSPWDESFKGMEGRLSECQTGHRKEISAPFGSPRRTAPTADGILKSTLISLHTSCHLLSSSTQLDRLPWLNMSCRLLLIVGHTTPTRNIKNVCILTSHRNGPNISVQSGYCKTSKTTHPQPSGELLSMLRSMTGGVRTRSDASM